MIGELFRSWRRKENPGVDNLTSVGSSIRNAAWRIQAFLMCFANASYYKDGEHIDFAPNVRSHY